jgi:hypothetical protein
MTVHTFVKGANTAAHLRSPAKQKIADQGSRAGEDIATQATLRVSVSRRADR